MSNPNTFRVTWQDRELIDEIMQRAHTMGLVPKQDALTIHMDLTACHANGCKLDLKALLNGRPFDFTHDVCGISRHIDRNTGKLRNNFMPRHALRKRAKQAQP